MAQWIRKPARVHNTYLNHVFDEVGTGCGFAFEVDPVSREVILTTPQAKANYARATAGVKNGSYIDQGIEDRGNDYWDEGAIQCHCGKVLELDGGLDDATRCTCGTEYDGTGQQLRANWRQFCRETGEISDDYGYDH